MKDLNITCIISAADTGGAVSVFEEIVAPGGGPPLHTHRVQIEVFHIIEGSFRFQVDDRILELGAGDSALVPKGAVHAFKNIGRSTGRIHFELLPSNRSEESFERLQADDGPIEDLAAFFNEYDMDLVGPPLD